MTQLNKLLTLKGEALRRGLHKTEFSKEDKRKSFKAINNNTNGGGANKYAPRYFKIDWDKASAGWASILAKFEDGSNIEIYQGLNFTASVKLFRDISIITSGTPNDYKTIIAFSFIPLYVPADVGLGIDWIKTIEDYIIAANFIFKNWMHNDIILSMEGITEITEEEYYKID